MFLLVNFSLTHMLLIVLFIYLFIFFVLYGVLNSFMFCILLTKEFLMFIIRFTFKGVNLYQDVVKSGPHLAGTSMLEMA